MNNPTIYSDGTTNSIQDSPLRVQNKMLGALKNLGGSAQTVGSASGLKSDQASIGANDTRKSLVIQNTTRNPMYIKLGAGAGATDYHFEVAGNGGVVGMGSTLNVTGYTGAVSIHPATNGYTLVEFE